MASRIGARKGQTAFRSAISLMRLSDLYQTDEAFEARREQHCGS